MDEMSSRLLAKLRAATASFKTAEGIVECCVEAASPETAVIGVPFHPRQQPDEIWEYMLRLIGGAMLNRRKESLRWAARRCQSPIEELFLLALTLVAETALMEGGLVIGYHEPAPFVAHDFITILTQAEVGDYHPDFLVTLYEHDQVDDGHGGRTDLWRRGSVLVECDGHDFHERTKEQAARDKKRDRELQTAGYAVYRFTGSEVWANAMSCAVEVITAARKRAFTNAPIATRQWSPRNRK